MITHTTRFATRLISFGLLSVSAYCVDHVAYVNVDLENGATTSQEHMSNDEWWWFVHDDNKDLYNPKSGSAEQPWISNNPLLVYKGSHSLQMTLGPRTSTTTPDRSELDVYHEGYSALPSGGGYGITPFKFYNPMYFGFAMNVHPSSGPLDSEVVFTQVWQSNTGSACGIPVTGVLERNSGGPNPWKFNIHWHDEVGLRSHEAVPSTVLQPGWHRFMFYLDPNPKSDPNFGRLSIYIDKDPKKDKADFDSLIDIGCNLSNQPGNVILDDWNIRVGLYRPNCADDIHCNILLDRNRYNLYVFYDNIRIGSDWDHVNPALDFTWTSAAR
jgi:hypothetical protein